MSEGQAHLCLGLYDDVEVAERDYQSLKVLHSSGRVAAYDAAVVFKDHDGKVAIQDRKKDQATATWTGVGVGALVGLLFPPAFVATTLVGGVTGALVGQARAASPSRRSRSWDARSRTTRWHWSSSATRRCPTASSRCCPTRSIASPRRST